jgi:hypothetical protein
MRLSGPVQCILYSVEMGNHRPLRYLASSNHPRRVCLNVIDHPGFAMGSGGLQRHDGDCEGLEQKPN